VLIATHHKVVNYQELADWAPCIIDSRNAMRSSSIVSGKASANDDVTSTVWRRNCLNPRLIGPSASRIKSRINRSGWG
jgi:hypothetical protein